MDARIAGTSDNVSTMRLYVARDPGLGLLVRTDGPVAARIPELRAITGAETALAM